MLRHAERGHLGSQTNVNPADCTPLFFAAVARVDRSQREDMPTPPAHIARLETAFPVQRSRSWLVDDPVHSQPY